MAPQEYGRVPFQDGKLCPITSITNLIIKQCSLDSIYPRYPESLLLHLQEGNNNLSECYTPDHNPKTLVSRLWQFIGLPITDFSGSASVSHLTHVIASPACDWLWSVLFRSIISSKNVFTSYNPIAASSSCSLYEMSHQLLLNIQLSWFILGSPLTSSNY